MNGVGTRGLTTRRPATPIARSRTNVPTLGRSRVGQIRVRRATGRSALIGAG